ncbi:hypothetical protein [Pseudomonas serbica]
MNGDFREEGEGVPGREFKTSAMQAITQQVVTAFCDTRFELFNKC